MMHKLTPLAPGDIIDIIAPGYACTKEDVERASAYISSLGYVPRVPNNIVDTSEPYHSQKDEVRFSHLRDALLAGDSKAVWCLRGGYGSARLLPGLEHIKVPKQAKWVIGFSDVTAIHLFLVKHWRWPVLHAPVLHQVNGKVAETSIERTLALLAGKTNNVDYHKVIPLNDAAKQQQTIHAPLVGGNLSLVQTGIGTSWQPQAKDSILFLEEYDEKGYAIDRMLVHLEQAGMLQQVKAVLIGDCRNPDHVGDAENVSYALERFAKEHPTLPVLAVTDIGHGHHNNPLPLGIHYTLVTGNNASLQCNLGELYG